MDNGEVIEPKLVGSNNKSVGEDEHEHQHAPSEMIRAGFFDLLKQTGLVYILFAASLLMTIINIVGLILIDHDSFKTGTRYLIFGVTTGLVIGIAVVVQAIVEKGIYFRRKAEP
jgi:uncharacterized membrane protein (DUF485 family)